MIIVLKHLTCSYKEGENGDPIPFNNTVVINTTRCCEGYTGTSCEVDLCGDLKCEEDPDHECVHVNKCGVRFPIFVTQEGFLSDKCTQPKQSEAYLCPDDVCAANETCPIFSKGRAVCLGSGCGCSSGPTWFVRQSGRETDCKSYFIQVKRRSI